MASMVPTKLKCTKCGNVYPIWRGRGNRRKDGHTKHVYCFKCQEVTAHVEARENEEWVKCNES